MRDNWNVCPVDGVSGSHNCRLDAFERFVCQDPALRVKHQEYDAAYLRALRIVADAAWLKHLSLFF